MAPDKDLNAYVWEIQIIEILLASKSYKYCKSGRSYTFVNVY